MNAGPKTRFLPAWKGPARPGRVQSQYRRATATTGPRQRIRFWDRYLMERIAIDDDSIPSAYLSRNGSRALRRRARRQDAIPGPSGKRLDLLDGRAAVERLERVPTRFASTVATPWLERYHRQLRVRRRGQRQVRHQPFCLIDGLNFVCQKLLGATNAYLSLAQQPDMVRRAIDFSFN